MTTIKHYFRRIFTNRINLLVLMLMPVGILVLNNLALQMVDGEELLGVVNDFSMDATALGIIITVMFAFFNTSLAYDFPFDDFKGPRRWRLLAAPVSLGKYIASNAVVSIVFSMLSSTLLMAVSVIAFNAYVPSLPHIGLVFAVIFVFTIFAQVFGLLLFLIFPKKSQAEAAVMGIVFGLFILAGQFIIAVPSLGTVGNFIFQRAMPNALAVNALFNLVVGDIDTTLKYLGFIGIYTVVTAIVVAIVSRRRPF